MEAKPMPRLVPVKIGSQAWLRGLALAVGLILPLKASAEEGQYAMEPGANSRQFHIGSGGVLAESYQYHRYGAGPAHAAQPSVTPSGGWYGYGFPVQTHRWGWFGAARYYPRVVWHRGYYDDCCRWGYRHGY
jgi:hypothetical protein